MKMFKDIKIDDDLFFYRIIPETQMVSETKTSVLSTWKPRSVDAISFSREEVEKDINCMYIFTDNTDRDSGKQLIDDNSWYSIKYGKGKHYPKVTTALIRGLNNAYPITTQRYYNNLFKGLTGRWRDQDIEEFKVVIDDDFEEIYKNAKRYDKIIFPVGGIFNSKISNISKERTPKLYNYLLRKLETLLNI